MDACCWTGVSFEAVMALFGEADFAGLKVIMKLLTFRQEPGNCDVLRHALGRRTGHGRDIILALGTRAYEGRLANKRSRRAMLSTTVKQSQ